MKFRTRGALSSQTALCGELSRSIKELEECVGSLKVMRKQVKQELQELQRALCTEIANCRLIEEKITVRQYWYESWWELLQQFQSDLASLKEKAARKGCSPSLINPCSQQQNGQLRCR